MSRTCCSLQSWKEPSVYEPLNPDFLALLQPNKIYHCLYIGTLVIQLPWKKSKVQVNDHHEIGWLFNRVIYSDYRLQ